MTTATFYQTTDMQSPYIWYGSVISATATQIVIGNGFGSYGIYYGAFTYTTFGLAGGSVTGYDSYHNSAIEYSVRGGSFDALTINNYLSSGNALALQQYVLSGNDSLIGSAGADILRGWGGNDYIDGGPGNDIVDGGAGDDTLYGGDGVDSFYGGSGIDTAVFAYDKGDYLVSKNPTTGSYEVIAKTGVIEYVNTDVEKMAFRDTTVDAASYTYYGTTDPVLAGSVSSVYRFFNTNDNAFFYTNSVAERDTVLANSDVSHNNVGEWPYVYQGSSFEAAHTYAKAVPLERFYNTVTHHHFFTSSATEAATVKANSASGAWPFVYEGVSLYVYASDPTPNSVGQEIPVERFYSATLNRHWFTADPTEITQIRLTGLWVDEGIGFWSEKPGA